MSAHDPRDSAAGPGKSPVDGFPSESPSPTPPGEDPGAIDEFVRSVRSRAAADGTAAAPPKTQFKPLYLVAAAAAGLIVVVVIRAWPTIDGATGTLGSRLISALTPTRLVEAPADDAAAKGGPATAAAPRRAARPAGADGRPVDETSPSVPAADQPIAAPRTADRSATDAESAAPLPERKESTALDTIVYSTADRDVEPPRLLSQGPGQPAKTMSERTRVLEVLVRRDGTVEQVQLKSTDPRLLDPILLSHAKMWHFDPAQRDGRPVAYRLVLMWDSPK